MMQIRETFKNFGPILKQLIELVKANNESNSFVDTNDIGETEESYSAQEFTLCKRHFWKPINQTTVIHSWERWQRGFSHFPPYTISKSSVSMKHQICNF